jgi:LemA protein
MDKARLGWLAAIGIPLLLVLVVVIWATSTYNGMVSSSQQVDKQWAQVQNVYQRRYDLIPNLVASVKGAADFEKSTLEAVVDARASVGKVQLDANSAPTDPSKLAAFEAAQRGLSGALSRLLVVVERYPDLKATTNFRDLQAQLEGTENRISVERGRFNDTVMAYNTTIKTFPGVMMAGIFGFSPKPYFAATTGAEAPPKVEFDFSKPAATRP